MLLQCGAFDAFGGFLPPLPLDCTGFALRGFLGAAGVDFAVKLEFVMVEPASLGEGHSAPMLLRYSLTAYSL
jgi:hypothetical protein